MSQVNYDNRKQNSKYKYFLFLLLIITVGIIVRLIITPYEIPISLDSFYYFTYSLALIEQGPFPREYLNVNFGWSSFVSLFFLFLKDSNMMDMMLVQRIVSISISVFTVIPIFYLLKKFFKKNIAIIGISIFCFEPHIIMNSVVGGTMPLFVLMVTCSIYFSILKKTKYFVLSFVFISLSSFVRYEGFLLFIPAIVSIFLQKNSGMDKIKNLCLSVFICLIVLIPILLVGYESDAPICNNCAFLDIFNYIPIISHLFSINSFITNVTETDIMNYGEINSTIKKEERFVIYFVDAFFAFSKIFGILLIPILVIILIPAIFVISKRFSRDKILIIIYSLIIILPSWYAVSRGIQDVRYLYPLIPIIILFSSTSIKKFCVKENENKIGIGIIIVLGIISFTFIGFQIEDYNIEEAVFNAATYIVQNSNGVNLEPGGKFLKIAEMKNNWRKLPQVDEKNKIFVSTKRISLGDYQNIEKFIEESKTEGLTHIVTYNQNEKDFLTEIFHNEGDYPYLSKVYDSNELGHKKQIKIFKINYAKFEKLS